MRGKRLYQRFHDSFCFCIFRLDLFCSHHGHTVADNSTWSTLLTCTADNVLDCTMFPHRTCSCVTPRPNGITCVAAIVSSFLQCVVWQLVSSVAVSIGSLLIPPLARFARFCHINCTPVRSAKPEPFKAPGTNCNHQRDVSIKNEDSLNTYNDIKKFGQCITVVLSMQCGNLWIIPQTYQSLSIAWRLINDTKPLH